jgi:hypothetical protein
MKTSTFAASAILLSFSQLCAAVQPGGMVPPPRPSSEVDLVERGGTINAIDAKKASIVIDGTAYSIPVGSVRIHTSTNNVTGSVSELKAGMQIRFSSSADASSNQSQLREVWVTGDGRRAAKP